MKGTIVEFNNGKGYQFGLLTEKLYSAHLEKQGRALVYILDEDYNIKLEIGTGKKIIGIIQEVKKMKVIGFQD